MKTKWIAVFCFLVLLLSFSQGCFDTSGFDICHQYEVRTDESNLTVTASTGSTVNSTGWVTSDVPGSNTSAIYRQKEGVPFRVDVIEFAWENAEMLILRYIFLKQPYHEFVKVYPLPQSPYQIYVGFQEHNPIAELVVTATPKNSSERTSFRLIDLCACKNGPPALCEEGQQRRNLSDFHVSFNGSLPFFNETQPPKTINAAELPGNTYASNHKDAAFFSVDFVLNTKEAFHPVLLLFRLSQVKMLYFGWYQLEEKEWRWDWWAFDKVDRDFPLTFDTTDRLDGKRVKAVRIVAESKTIGKHFGFAIDRLDVCVPPPLQDATPPPPTTTTTTKTTTRTTTPTTTTTSTTSPITDLIPAQGQLLPLPLNIKNPCTDMTRASGRFYFPHPRRPELFIQCDVEGNAYVVACASGLVFLEIASVCVHG